MAIYFNPITKEFPRHDGDIKLIDPDWKPGTVLPEPWVEVEVVEAGPAEVPFMPVLGEPKFIDGVWKMTWDKREMTQEEIDKYSQPTEESL